MPPHHCKLLHKTYPPAFKMNSNVGKLMVGFCHDASKDAQGTIQKYESSLDTHSESLTTTTSEAGTRSLLDPGQTGQECPL